MAGRAVGPGACVTASPDARCVEGSWAPVSRVALPGPTALCDFALLAGSAPTGEAVAADPLKGGPLGAIKHRGDAVPWIRSLSFP